MQEKLKDFSKRLELLMQSAGLENVNQLSKSLGYSRPTKLYSILENTSLPSIETVADILATYPKVSARWLLLGQGEPGFNAIEIESVSKTETPAYETLDLMKKVAAFEQDIKLRDMQYSQLMARFNDVLVKVSELMQEIDSIKKPLKKPIIQKATR